MVNILKNKVCSYFFYNHIKRSYSKVSNIDHKEEVYCKDDKLVIAINDEEIGEQIFNIVRILKDKKDRISSSSFKTSLKIDNYVIDKQNRVKLLYIDFAFSGTWEKLSRTEQLQEMVAFVEGMQNKGYILDVSKFEKEKCSSISAFLSFFTPSDVHEDDPKGCLIEYIHYILSDGVELKEFYKSVVNNVFCRASEFPYNFPVIKMCYDYFVSGIIPEDIYGILESEITAETIPLNKLFYNYLILGSITDDRFNKVYNESKNGFRWDLIANKINIESAFELNEENDEYKIYDRNIKIYQTISPEFETFLRENNKIIKTKPEQIVEQIDELIIDFNGNIIGYKFKNQEIQNAYTISEVNFNNPSEIFDFMLMLINNIKEVKELHSCCTRLENDFNIENSFVLVNGNVKISKIKDVFNLVSYNDEDMLKDKIITIFFKLYLRYISDKYGRMDNKKQFFDKIEIRYLSPVLAREFINYALNKTIDYNMARIEFFKFLFTTKISTNNGYVYDSRFYYNPSKASYLFDYEVEKMYGIKIDTGMNETLSDGRTLITFKRKKTISGVRNIEKSLLDKITKQFGNITDKNVKIAGISEIIYSPKIDSDYMYKVVGYITSPVKGKQLNDEFLLSLSNKDFLKVAGYLFTKFEDYYYIDLNSIWMDDDFVFYINIFDKNFQFKRYSNQRTNLSFLQWISSNLLDKNCNPNTFINIELSKKYSNFKEYALCLANKLDSYCDEHSIYYDSKYGMCPICLKTKYFVPENFDKNAVLLFEDMYAKHYRIDNDYNLKVYKTSCIDVSEMEKNIDNIIIKRLNFKKFKLHQDCFVPYKKAIDSNNQFIGYIYKTVKFDSDLCIDLSSTEKLKNLPRLMSLIRLILQIKEIAEENLGFTKNPFSHVFLSKSHKKQVQILNIEFLSKNASLKDTRKWTCEYVCQILASDESIEIDVSDCSTDLNSLLKKLQSISKAMTKYCSIHNMYYRNKYLFCPKCFDRKQMESIKSELVDLSAITKKEHIGEGGESLVYSYQDSVAKIFKANEIDYNFKNMIIVRILSKKEILDEINNQGNLYKYVYPQKFLVDNTTHNICGYAMEKINGMPISSLRYKDKVEELGFTVKDVLEILITVGKGIETLHTKANIYIGDLNGGNILFDSQKNVYFLDFDGMGVDDLAPTFCTDGYIDPVSKKNHNITMKDDWYSFAIQAFYYLTFVHPFKGRYIINNKNLDIEERMEGKISLLGDHGIQVPAIARPWDWMCKELKTAFLNIFEFDNRSSIVPVLEFQYKKLFSTNFEPTIDNIVRINPKFIAKEINLFKNDVVRVINQYSAICRNRDKYFLAIIVNTDIHEIDEENFDSINCMELKNVLLSEDGRIAFCIFENEIYVVDLNIDTGSYRISSNKVAIDNKTLYISESFDETAIFTKIDYVYNKENRDISVVEDKMRFLPQKNVKKFLVRCNYKFVLVTSYQDDLDEIYCNTQKLCSLRYDSKDSKYNIIYDEITKWWLVVNSDGYGVIIKSNGEYKYFSTKHINDNNIDNINFNKGKVYVPCQDRLCIINGSDQLTIKKMECNKIMTPNSKIYNINTYGYSVITDNKLYEVRRG